MITEYGPAIKVMSPEVDYMDRFDSRLDVIGTDYIGAMASY